MSYYAEIFAGEFPGKRGNIVHVSALPALHAQFVEKKPVYESYYKYEESMARIAKTVGVSAYKGKFFAPSILLDIDPSPGESEARLVERTKSVLDRLQKVSGTRLYFSGRGMHITIPNTFAQFVGDFDLPSKLGTWIDRIFPDTDNLASNRTRLVRMPGSLNGKSTMRKVQVDIDRFRQQDILGGLLTYIPLRDKPLLDFPETQNDNVEAMIVGPKIMSSLSDIKHVPTVDLTVPAIEDPIPRRDPLTHATCIQNMYEGGPSKGSRHVTMLRIASSWMRNGVPQDATVAALQRWVQGSDFPPEDVLRAVESVYRVGYKWKCSDPIMAKYCDPRCTFYGKKNYTLNVHTGATAVEELRGYIKRTGGKPLVRLSQMYPNDLDGSSYDIFRGEFVVFLGDTKVGKSTFMMNLADRMINSFGIKVLYLSSEMPIPLTYRRMLQVRYQKTREEILDMLAEDGIDPIAHLDVMHGDPDQEELRRIIREQKPDVVIIDVIDDLNYARKMDETPRIAEVGRMLKQIAERESIVIIGIHPLSKSAVEPDRTSGRARSLTIHSGKGSSTLEQKADKVLTLEKNPLTEGSAGAVLQSQGARDEGAYRSYLFGDLERAAWKHRSEPPIGTISPDRLSV